MGDFVNKYTQVPGALLTRAIEFSPAGYAKLIFDISAISRENAEINKANAERGFKMPKANLTAVQQRRLALTIGRATTGTGLILFFMAAAAKGILRRADDDKDKNAQAMQAAAGISGTQINLSALGRWIDNQNTQDQNGDMLIGVEFLQPLNSLMTIGSLIAQSKEGNLTAQKWAEAVGTGIALSMGDLSVMNTVQTIESALQYSDDTTSLGEAKAVLVALSKNSLTGFVPSVFRQAAQAGDTLYRDTYGRESVTDQILDPLKATVPGLRETVPSKLTGFGQEKQYGGDVWQRISNAFVTPGSVRTYNIDPVSKEVLDVYHKTGDATVLPERNAPNSFTFDNNTLDLTYDQKRLYQQTMGQAAQAWLGNLIGSDSYKGMTNDERAEAMAGVISLAEKMAREIIAAQAGVKSTRLYSPELTKEVYRLEAGGATGIQASPPDNRDTLSDPKKKGYVYTLDAKAMDTWREFYNDVYEQAMAGAMSGQDYKDGSDAEKSALLQAARDTVADAAREQFLEWMRKNGYKSTEK